ncbi:calcium/sodium antiporter [Candidatus Nomurabacteria bacterium]|nr:calcium/sodium antiporter [Candidatus Nomurabacteria bacterium]
MTLIIWIVVFIVSLALLVKSADWLLDGAEKIGLWAGLSPFIVGVTIVAVGTSVPELVSSIAAVVNGISELVVANAVGSNIANILLVLGVATLVGKNLKVTKDLIDLDLPLLTLGTTVFLILAWDGQISLVDSIFLILTYLVYVIFTIVYKEGSDKIEPIERPKLNLKVFVLLAVGIIGIGIGANYLIESVIALSTILNIGTGVIAITAVAVGTSLPEVLVSAKAALRGQPEVALGNVFGSNIFNVLMVVGVPGIFGRLSIDNPTMMIGFPFLILATAIFVVSGISRKIHIQEGIMYLLIYALFVIKLFGWF